MKLIIAAATAGLLFASGAATAQTNAGADVKMENAGKTKAKTSTHVRKHRATTGRGGIETRDNNASARGSILPGKDRLNSKAFIADH